MLTPEVRRQTLTVVLLATLVVLVGWITVDRMRHRDDAQLARDNAVSIAEQVRTACARQGEVARALGDLCQTADDVVAAPAEPIPGAPGRDGVDGADGRDGRDGRDGVDGRDGRDGVDGRDGADGESREGPPGRAGADGADGRDGGPGAPGAQGVPGPAGAAGRDGADGRPPAGWAFEHCTDGGCVAYRCEPAPGFDVLRPTYTCRPVEGGPDSPAPDE